MLNLRATLVLSAYFLCLAASPAQAAANPVLGAARTPAGLALTLRDGFLWVDIWSDNTVRVRYAKGENAFAAQPGLAVTGQPAKVSWTHLSTANAEVARTAKLSVSVDRKTGAISFLDAAGRPYLREATNDTRQLTPKNGAYAATQQFALAADESIYGLGQHSTGQMDNRGSMVHLQQLNTDVAVPVFVSSKGYGVFWNNASVTDVDIPSPSTASPCA